MSPPRRTVLLATLLSSAASLPGQGVATTRTGLPTRSERVVSYTMRVRLDAEKRSLSGNQTVRYRNRTQGSTQELQWHLYLNAFRNPRSTHLRESPELVARYKSKEEFGQIRFTKLHLVAGNGALQDVLPELGYIAPDDGNADDRTVARVPLPAAFGPGDEIVLQTEFEADLPKAYRRTGWGPGNFFMVAQWFPKLGVLEDATSGAKWNCHQFHAWTEFFADFGTYDVTIETPKGFAVGATGQQVGPTKLAGEYEVRRFRQEDVHDFAWVTDPDFVVEEYDWSAAGKLDPAIESILVAAGWGQPDLALSDVRVRMLLHPEHATDLQKSRHRKAVDVALRFFGSRYGRYPYATLTVVDPCTDVDWQRLGGGMEYPTLITCGTGLFLDPRRLRPEGVTVHEFGHQFWYGLSANNEFEESWLDEGICSYSEGRALDLAYATGWTDPPVGDPLHVTDFEPFAVRGLPPARLAGVGSGPWARASRLEQLSLRFLQPVPGGSELRRRLESDLSFNARLLPDLPIVSYLRTLPFLTFEGDIPYSNLYNDRAKYLSTPEKDPVVKLAWLYLDRESYRDNSYQRPATILCTLERMMGPDKWWPCMRRFHERARFAHASTEDFLQTLEEFGGAEVAAFAREAFYTTKRLDYGIEKVEAHKDPQLAGYFDAGEDREGGEVVVTVRRFGELVVPVKVRFEFAKAGAIEREWPAEGQGSWRRFRFPGEEIEQKGELLRVLVDPPVEGREVGDGPAGTYVLDADLTNNSWQARSNKAQARRRGIRMLLWAEMVLSFFGGLG